MQKIFVNASEMHISSDCYLIDNGEIATAHITSEKNIKIHYTHIPQENCENIRYFSLAESVDFCGNSVISVNGKYIFTTEAIGDGVHSALNILGIASHEAHISAEGIAKVDKPYKQLNMRVDQTNILIGDKSIVRGVPRLEIATDDIEGGHSCKIHRLWGDSLFYLESHGMNAKDAEIFLLNSEILRHLNTLPEEDMEISCSSIHKNILKK